MTKPFDPNAIIPWHNSAQNPTTYKEYYWDPLTDEAIRDIARNDSNDWRVRKEAVKLLMERGSKYADLPYLAMLAAEIKLEQTAREEVVSAVESATEQPLPSETDILREKIQRLEAELQSLRNPALTEPKSE